MSAMLVISAAFEQYRYDYIVMRNLSPKTEEAYIYTSKLLIKYFGDVDIETITFDNVRDWRNHIAGWQKPDTVRNNIVCLRMVLKYLRRKGYKVLNYEDIPVSKRTKRTITYLTEEEVYEFIDEVKRPVRGYSKVNRARNAAIITLLFATGLRNNELCSLDRNSIKERQFTVIGKSKNPRIGFINQRAEDALNEYLKCRNDSDRALFISPQTGKRIRPGTLRRIFQNTCERSDFKNIHPHTIRHSYATYLLSKEVDIRYIGDLMGHVSLDTTKLYTHYSNPQLKRVYETAQGY
jgi:integrase/recombinase XerD